MGNIDFNQIQEAVKARDEFLQEHPELQPLQDAINQILEKSGKNHHSRQVAIQTLMLNTWHQVVGVWEGKVSKAADVDQSKTSSLLVEGELKEEATVLNFPNKK